MYAQPAPGVVAKRDAAKAKVEFKAKQEALAKQYREQQNQARIAQVAAAMAKQKAGK